MTSMVDHETARPTATAIEAWLSAQLRRRLKLSNIDPERPLSELGLNSLAAMRLLDALEAWLGEKFPPTIFFEYANLRSLATALASGKVAESREYVAADADCY